MNLFLQIIIGYILADFLAGFVHWFEDTYLDYNSNIPFLNEISKHNELHHYFPRTIVSYSYLENIISPLVILLIIFLLIFIFSSKSLSTYPFLYASFFLFGLFSNVIHKFSHMRECELPVIILFLQNIGVLCSHSIHREHHVVNNSSKYCVISPYLNPILDEIGFWRFIENIIYFITGIEPNRKGKYNDYEEIHTYIHENAKQDCPDVPTKNEINMLFETLDEYIKKKSNTL